MAASRALWMALHAPPTTYAGPEDATQWLIPLIKGKSVDVNMVHEGITPLLVWLRHFMDAPYATAPDPEVMAQITSALLEQGANPWMKIQEPSHSRGAWNTDWGLEGFGPFAIALHAKDAEVQPTIADLFLAHPSRPDWDILLNFNPGFFRGAQVSLFESLGQYPWLVPLLVKHGWDPNTVNQKGHNVAFYLNTVVAWEAAQECGVDFQHHDHQGNTVLMWQEKRQKLTQDQRTWLVGAAGQTSVNDEQIWQQALTGKVSQLIPLLPDTKKQVAWRWTPASDAPEMNLLDAAAVAALRPERDHGKRHQLKSETALLNRLLKAKADWPETSLALAHLATTMSHGGRIVLTGGSSNTTLAQFLVGMNRYAAIAAHHDERFSWNRWWAAAATPKVRQRVRDAWLVFMMTCSGRWSQGQYALGDGMPVGYSDGPVEAAVDELRHSLEQLEPGLDREQRVVAITQNILISHQQAKNSSRPPRFQEASTGYAKRCLHLLSEALAALPEGSQAVRDRAHEALSPHPALAAVCVADQRRRGAQQITSSLPTRPGRRLRP